LPPVWLYSAHGSSNVDIPTRIVESVSERSISPS
jgi:hypothetical protein